MARRRPTGVRVQNLPIRSKILILVAVPLVALGVVGVTAIGSGALNATRGATVEQVAGVAPALSELVDALQEERRLAAAYVGGSRTRGLEALRRQYPVVDERVTALEAQVEALEGAVGGGYEALRDGVGRSDLESLAQTRRRVEGGADVTPEVAADLYTTLTRDLIGISADLGSGSDSERLLGAVSAATAAARIKDAAAQEQAIVGATISARRIEPGQVERLLLLAENQDFWAAQYRAAATPAQEELLDGAVGGDAATRTATLRDRAVASPGGRVGIDAEEWATASGALLEELGQVEQKVAEDVAAAGAAVARAAVNQVIVYSAGLVAVLAVSVVSSVLVGRSLSRPIKRLSGTAKRVAHERIPGVVARMERAEEVDLAQEVEPSGVTSHDEIGELAAAFDTLHQVAVRIAAEQSALRRSVSDMILNLARRSQVLTDRLLEHITDLERDEADPATLAKLFQLDHLATRMRRTAENLVVFSGNEPPRRWSEPVALPDIVEAAVAEAEEYTRVRLLGMDEVELQGRAANDVTHLLAELIDNATSFSPPTTAVTVAGQFVGRGYLIEIEDRGIGMTPDDLDDTNRRLADPPAFDFAVRQRLGLFVVGRLAQRYGMKVQLRHSVSSGVTALVMVPVELLSAYPEEFTARAGAMPQPSVDRSGRRPPLTPVGSAAVVPAAVAPTTGSLPIFEETRSDWAAGVPAGLATHHSSNSHNDQTGNHQPGDGHPGTGRSGNGWTGNGRTGNGLPRRTPNASYGPGPAAATFGPPAPAQPGRRPPEQIRDLLSSFQSGITQGRDESGTRRPPTPASPWEPHELAPQERAPHAPGPLEQRPRAPGLHRQEPPARGPHGHRPHPQGPGPHRRQWPGPYESGPRGLSAPGRSARSPDAEPRRSWPPPSQIWGPPGEPQPGEPQPRTPPQTPWDQDPDQ